MAELSQHSELDDTAQSLIDEICDDFEQARRAGDERDLGEWLERAREFPATQRALLCELIWTDATYRVRSGRQPDWSSYGRRFFVSADDQRAIQRAVIAEAYREREVVGSPGAIQQHLATWAVADDDEMLLEIVGVELARRRGAGEPESLGEFIGHWPQLADHPPVLCSEQVEVTQDSPCHAAGSETTSFHPSGESPRNFQQIGRYTVLQHLGGGGQADVYRCLHPTLPTDVAVKVSKHRFDEQARQALQQEAKILFELR